MLLFLLKTTVQTENAMSQVQAFLRPMATLPVDRQAVKRFNSY